METDRSRSKIGLSVASISWLTPDLIDTLCYSALYTYTGSDYDRSLALFFRLIRLLQIILPGLIEKIGLNMAKACPM